MSGTALSTGQLPPKLRRGPDGSCVTRGQVEARYRAARPHGKPHGHQLDALTAMVDWLARCYRTDGARVHRSISQIVRALERAGVETKEGTDAWRREPTVKDTRRRFRSTIVLRLNTLIELGYVESWEPVYGTDGRGAGIVVRLTADVAQLAAAPLIRRRRSSRAGGTTRTRRRAFHSATVEPPPTGSNSVDSAWKAVEGPSERGGASARPDRRQPRDAIGRS